METMLFGNGKALIDQLVNHFFFRSIKHNQSSSLLGFKIGAGNLHLQTGHSRKLVVRSKINPS